VDTGIEIETDTGVQKISRIGRETSIVDEEGSGDSQEPKGIIEEPKGGGEVPKLDSRGEKARRRSCHIRYVALFRLIDGQLGGSFTVLLMDFEELLF
jgi:hypothetical protein